MSSNKAIRNIQKLLRKLYKDKCDKMNRIFSLYTSKSNLNLYFLINFNNSIDIHLFSQKLISATCHRPKYPTILLVKVEPGIARKKTYSSLYSYGSFFFIFIFVRRHYVHSLCNIFKRNVLCHPKFTMLSFPCF